MRSVHTLSPFHLITVGICSMVQLVPTELGYAVCRALAEQIRMDGQLFQIPESTVCRQCLSLSKLSVGSTDLDRTAFGVSCGSR